MLEATRPIKIGWLHALVSTAFLSFWRFNSSFCQQPTAITDSYAMSEVKDAVEEGYLEESDPESYDSADEQGAELSVSREMPSHSSNGTQRTPTTTQSTAYLPRSHEKTPSRTSLAGNRGSRTFPEVSRSANPTEGSLVSVLGDLTNTVGQLAKRLDKQDSRLESIERKISSAGSDSGGSKQQKVPAVVRVSIFHAFTV